MSQLREGRRRRKLGRPGQRQLASRTNNECGRFTKEKSLPIIRKTGLPSLPGGFGIDGALDVASVFTVAFAAAAADDDNDDCSLPVLIAIAIA